eukprot:CAMPEP_0168549018 /NCGR_PEP_ID=MMETSP0413-20121227/4877_1 /TAXON_ID=136452 /ORGANISM="Filamoeba nolandi, Strain NC-AS-23-1" /LENGTH=98 /DNA_ID=CAMNT_0008579373 /DNA_START=549 /DNA_END=841 /DNA_ORIENTATION=+
MVFIVKTLFVKFTDEDGFKLIWIINTAWLVSVVLLTNLSAALVTHAWGKTTLNALAKEAFGSNELKDAVPLYALSHPQFEVLGVTVGLDVMVKLVPVA